MPSHIDRALEKDGIDEHGRQNRANSEDLDSLFSGASEDLDSLFGSVIESIRDDKCIEFAPNSIPAEVSLPPKQDPTYGLQWTNDSSNFLVKPVWTVEPTVQSIISTLQEAIDPSSKYTIEHLWDGAYSKIYAVSVGPEQFVMRITLPVCPKTMTESEVATMKWVNDNTNLPVPKVKCYDSSRDNPLGFEWILMGRVDGVPLSHSWNQISQDAKQRIVKQIADYAAICFEKQFRGIGNIYPSMTHASDDHLSQDTGDEGRLKTSARMLELVNRLRDLEDRFFPTPEFSHNADQLEEGESTDEDEDEGAINGRGKQYEPTMLWHDDISLDNIFVDHNGILCGVIDWKCISCLPLYEACRLPAFLRQRQDRFVEPSTPYRVTRRQFNDSWGLQKYNRDLRQHQLTLLRQLFVAEMTYRCPGWAVIYRNRRALRDYEAAVQNCDNEFAYEMVENWVGSIENGDNSWWLSEHLMGW
ncbi:kinase-like domain-containing protein [Hypomontagnella monticulosa]|nr:kinase-like domain-containing protein [Hypomontagnella monticulosa]